MPLDGQTIFGSLETTSRRFSATAPDGRKTLFFEKDAIYNLCKTPIEPGDLRTGHLVISFKKKPPSFDKHLLRIRFRDYLDHEFETTPLSEAIIKPGKTIPNLSGFHLEQDPT